MKAELWVALQSAERGGNVPRFDVPRLPLGDRHLALVCEYVRTGASTVDTAERDKAAKALTAWLRDQLLGGHCSADGSTEAGCGDVPSSQWIAGTALAWREALRRNDDALASACLRWFGSELALARAFKFRGVVVAPGPMVEGQIRTDGKSRVRDLLAAMALQAEWPKFAKPGRWWAEAGSMGPRILREEVFAGPEGDARRKSVVTASAGLRLRVPIRKVNLPSGYVAWIEPTPDARQILPKAVSWIEHTGDGVRCGFDWQTKPPEFPEGSRVTVIGG